MPDVQIAVRLAEARDLPALHAVIERAYRGDTARAGWTHEADLLEGQRTDSATLAALLADPAARLLVAESDDTPLGCVSIADRGDGLTYLGLLCVEPLLQAHGIGKLLIDEAEALAASTFAARRIEMTVIDVRRDMIAYYERRGYHATGETRPIPVPGETYRMAVLVKDL